jgi:hypothetical protein
LSGREAGRAASVPLTDPETLEVVPGVVPAKLEGWIPELTSPEELREALEQAFDYRGDVLITRKDESKVEGYIFDRTTGNTLEESFVRLLPKDGSPRTKIAYSDIAALAFTGRDMAAGKSWEAWLSHYWEKKNAGERNISIQPEKLE